MALAAPGLQDRQRWSLASSLCAALFGEEAAYLLGDKEVRAYVSQLDGCKKLDRYSSVPIINVTTNGLELTVHTRMIYLEECCIVKAGLAASERGLYEAFCQWWTHSFACSAPPLEMFRAMISTSFRRFTLPQVHDGGRAVVPGP